MLDGLRSVLERTAPTIVEDALGCLALAVILFVGLHLPGMV